MIYLHCCSLHGKARNKLCGCADCCQVFCDDCLPGHFNEFQHFTAICLNSQSLNLFETFTGYTHYKMFDWIDLIRKNGFFALFEMVAQDGSFWESKQSRADLTAIGIRALQDHQKLMQNNRQFVLNNKNSELLYHPQFLKDIFNLVTEGWEVSAAIILTNLKNLLQEKFGPLKSLPAVRIQNCFSNSIQSYRRQLTGKIEKQIIFTAESLLNPAAHCIDGKAEVARGNTGPDYINADAEKIEYELPYSIKQIESFEQIGERAHRAHNTVCSITAQPETQEGPPENAKEVQLKEMRKLRQELEMLKIDNLVLQEENRLLKGRNFELEKEKDDLNFKVQAYSRENKENKLQCFSFSDKISINPEMAIRKIRIVK